MTSAIEPGLTPSLTVDVDASFGQVSYEEIRTYVGGV